MPTIPVTPQSFHLDLMNQTFRVDGVTDTGTLATVGLFADVENDYAIQAALALGKTAEFSNAYYFYFEFTPEFDLRKSSDGTINMSFQMGDERANWETVYYTYYDSSVSPAVWQGTGGDLSGKTRTNSQFFGVDTDAAKKDTATFKGYLTRTPYRMQIWREIKAEDTQDVDGNEIYNDSVRRYEPGQVIAAQYQITRSAPNAVANAPVYFKIILQSAVSGVVFAAAALSGVSALAF